jgi:hypothetical protein
VTSFARRLASHVLARHVRATSRIGNPFSASDLAKPLSFSVIPMCANGGPRVALAMDHGDDDHDDPRSSGSGMSAACAAPSRTGVRAT